MDPDLDVGGRVFLIDGFTAVAQRVGRSVTQLRGAYTQGVRAISGASRSMTDGLRQTARTAGTTIQGLAQTVQRGWRTFAQPRGAQGQFLTTPFTRLQGWIGAAQGQIGAFVRRSSGLLNGLGRSFGRALDGLTASMGGLSRYLSPAGLLGGFADLVRAATSAASSMENNRLAFTTLLGSAQLARDHLAELQQFAIGRPFEFADLVTQSRYLQTFGFRVGEITGLLTDFGNAAFTANTGIQGVNSMSRVFGTILATNKTTFGQLRQLVSAGVPAFQILRDELHLNDRQLQNIARSGIPAQQVIAALRRGMQGRFSGGMDRAAATITARLSDLQDVAGQFLTMVGDQLRPVIGGFLDDFGGALGTTQSRMVLARRVADALATGMRLLRGVVAVLGGAVTDLGDRWQRGTGRIARSWMTSFATVRDVTEGVVALLAGEDARGMSRIPRSLHDRLVRQGLWPLVLKVAQWGDRMRQVVSGFLEGVALEARAAGETFRGIAEGLGLARPGMQMNRAEARQLGRDLARLVRGYMALRVAMIGLGAASTVVSAAMTFGKAIGAVGRGLLWAGRMVVRFVRWLPVAGAWIGRVTSFLRALGTVASRVIGNPFAGLARGGPILAILAAQILGTIALWRNWNAIQGRGARATGIRALASLLLGPWYALVHVVKEGPRQVAALGRGVVGVARAVGPVVGRALSAVGRFLWAGLVAAFTPVGRFFRVIGAFLVVALYVALASLWVRARVPLTAFAEGVRALVVRAGRAALGVFDGVARGVGAVAGRVRDVVAAAGVAVAGFMLGVAVRVAGFGARVMGVARRVRSTVAGFFGGLATRAFAWIAPLLARVAMVAVRLRELLGGAFQWVASTAQTAFGRLAEIILSPLRSIAARLVALFRALPRGMQPASLQGMVGDLEAFSRSSGGPVGGEPPAPTPAPTPAAPGPPPVQVSQRQQAAGQAAGRAAPPPAPVTVNVPQPVVQQVRVIVDGRELAASVERRQEGERLRQGR